MKENVRGDEEEKKENPFATILKSSVCRYYFRFRCY